MTENKLKDLASERALLSTVIKGGKDSYIDASTYVSANDFSLSTNRAVWQCLDSLFNDQHCNSFDTDTIKLRAKAIGLDESFKGKKELEYLEFLNSSNFDKENIQVFAMQVKKLAVVRDLHKRYIDAIDYIQGVSGAETLSEIITKAEGKIIDFISGVENEKTLDSIGKDIDQYVDFLVNREEIDQIGIPTGYTLWDQAVGGGLRRGTISVIAARPKQR